MLIYKHNEYEYIYDDNTIGNSMEIRKDGIVVDNIESPISNLKDAKNLENTVIMLGLDNQV
ncbi:MULTISPECIES: hypothetical protein [unclassified Clostridium]|uniref:hypothetical protein n=1 Tax=unclassified Clostridium TaxID=2614128 RepID=UPI00023B023D|nr:MULTISPECIES: hypothetical protein [unclassified Clostridium]EHI99929.1 hypothetical protein CDLVIII_3365 [Clostridium sp. DL-VIII]OOM68240.1 hypothetical protein CLOBL_53640 [Clostridium sp. BL-8]